MDQLPSKSKQRNARRSPTHLGLASRWLLLVVGVAVVSVQSFIVKPHFHTAKTDSLISVAEIQSETNSGVIQYSSASVEDEANIDGLTHNEAPTDLDFSDCTMCKTAHQDGQYLRPAAAVFSLAPPIVDRRIKFSLELIFGTPKSFSWQTRAPPQA